MTPAKARNTSLTSSAFRNTAATSGSSTTTTLPVAYRDAYLLGSARLKSYSGSISSALPDPACLVVLRAFFIFFPFKASRWPRADQTNSISPLGEHHRRQAVGARKTEQDESFFANRMSRIGCNPPERIAENGRRFPERYCMLSEICGRFLRIPFEPQRQPSL